MNRSINFDTNRLQKMLRHYWVTERKYFEAFCSKSVVTIYVFPINFRLNAFTIIHSY